MSVVAQLVGGVRVELDYASIDEFVAEVNGVGNVNHYFAEAKPMGPYVRRVVNLSQVLFISEMEDQP